ncbi:unnamed protein product [Didymodactylos carnosus]|uniref:RING-type E3 ubiquitin-protein ligase PPIL2 n=1 Tax=Didymodactylos carnosus TaxID=1234261 RepID=A0A813XT32_9BILA|nr:unnamed protein product [Didymodactylos carnosus]CAF1037451.1 unnamed protein product [Didymodactylos carnosus]CAF3661897.1 unnamed protein product [Didymodactylos carnosus]CAF3805604.1 unnamed protein product [Didymodactylos carnosus]
MGKKQHQQDKMYLTATEWKTYYGGHKGVQHIGGEFRRLPFSCCSISFLPFENPYCSPEGIIFDLENIVPFLKKYGRNPVTGEKLDARNLIKLNFHKNSRGEYHCPITYKIFNENSHIVSIRPSGNVYSLDAIERLNVKPNNFQDLLTSEPFVKKDIITLQDPQNLDKFNIVSFKHLKNEWKLEGEEDERARRSDPTYFLKCVNNETAAVLNQLKKTSKSSTNEFTSISLKDNSNNNESTMATKADSVNIAPYSTGRLAASFTSTIMEPVTHMEAAKLDEDDIRWARMAKSKKKGYVRMVTNMGQINIELFCDQCPQTCENFIKHCANKYYVGSKFFRSIKNFIVQGGDPTNTGHGGQSIWDKTFKDEIHVKLEHTGRGMLSMANFGPNTNKSQFFFTYRSCKSLNGKHTVFGKIVGGIETLSKIEAIPTDSKDVPEEDVIIEDTIVFVDPYEEIDEKIRKEREKATKEEEEEEKRRRSLFTVKSATTTKSDSSLNTTNKVYRPGVGKYISNQLFNSKPVRSAEDESEYSLKKKRKIAAATTIGTLNFSQW